MPSPPPNPRESGTNATRKRCCTRRKFLAGLAVLGLSGASYTRFVEPTWLEVREHEVHLGQAGRQSPLRLLHLSDLHASDVVHLDYIEEAIEVGLSLQPDLICVTGDFVTHRYGRLEAYSKVLSKLPQAAPAFASLGNHDGGLWAGRNGGYADVQPVLQLLAQSGLTVLPDTAVSARINDRELELIGLSDLWAGDFVPEKAFAAADAKPGAIRILLSHNPDTKDHLGGYAWDLMLSGHTHGGQFQFPLIGAPFAPVEDKRFIEGLHRWDGRWLHITKGVGNVHGLRFNCRPDVSLLLLT